MALYSAKKWVDISSYGLISFPMHRGAKWAKYILGNDSHLLFVIFQISFIVFMSWKLTCQ